MAVKIRRIESILGGSQEALVENEQLEVETRQPYHFNI